MADKHRLTFLDPVTGTAVPCGRDGQAPSQLLYHPFHITLTTHMHHMHQGYVLKLPSKFLQQHGGKIRDGLTVLKCIAAIGQCAGGCRSAWRACPETWSRWHLVLVKGVASGL